MSRTRLVLRSLTYHWRTNLAVCLGVAAAVAVLGGALLVGDSVRGSLRDLALSRLGRTGQVLSSAGYFREALAADLAARGGFDTAPLVTAGGFVTHDPSRRRASNVLVYGVDERFWRFHGVEPVEGVFASPALAAELGAADGDVLLTRLQRPSEIPLESLFAQKEDLGRTLRLTLRGTLPRERLGEFATRSQQGEVRALFVPLATVQRELDVNDTVNTVLLPAGAEAAAVGRAFDAAITLEDVGVTIEPAAGTPSLIVESPGGILSDSLASAARETARALGLTATPVFTYLANTMRIGERQVPYSLVSGVDLRALRELASPGGPPPGAASGPAPGAPMPNDSSIVLNEWAARELHASVGDGLEIEYFLWDAAAGLRTATAQFTVYDIVSIAGLAADRRLAPVYPGITGADSLADWDPPFPLDLSRVRPQDEAYWDEYRTTAKAFISYEKARELWSTRYGALTSLRVGLPASEPPERVRESFQAALRERIRPASEGLALVPARRLALEASTGATNFGEYFTYFSFFIVVSAVILAMLFFRLGVEGRLRQIGIMRAAGYPTALISRLLLAEGAILAMAGSVIGVAGAVGYAHLIIYGLETWWVGAINTTLLDVHIRPVSLVLGAAGGVAAALACVWLSLRAVARRTPRSLMTAQSLEDGGVPDTRRSRRSGRAGSLAAVLGLALMTLGFLVPGLQAGAFFGAGAALLAAILFFLAAWLRARDRRPLTGHGAWAVSRLGFRSAAFRPGRSVMSAALVAAAAFIIVSVDAFRRGGAEVTTDPRSGTGGYALIAQTDVPLVHNPNDPAGREALVIQAEELADVRFSRFRLRPGEDASCLNLYRPANPTLIAPEASFIDSGRFAFADSIADTDDERQNPWRLLRRTFEDGTVPAIADATSLQYVLHLSLGDTMTIDVGAAEPLVLRFVGALRDSVLQGEIVIGEEHFVRLFPGQEGYRFFLVESPSATTREEARALAEAVEQELEPFGLDAVVTSDRLDAFHRVENTYLSTFQALGGLGLLLGTIGLATVMFRNVLERRRELALLRAVGYDGRDVSVMIVAETMFLVACGLGAGVGCAIIAVAPAWLAREGSAPGIGFVLLLGGVLVAGLLSALAATRAAVSGGLLGALRAE